MDFSFAEEQELLRNSLRSFLGDRYNFQQRRTAVQSALGWRPEIWKSFASDLGILAMALPAECGGLDADAVTTMVVMEEFGRSLVVEPYVEAVVLCGGLLARADLNKTQGVLRRLGRGEEVAAFAWSEAQSGYDFAQISTTATASHEGWRLDGSKCVVIGAPWSTQLLVTARTAGSAGERDGVSLFLVGKSAVGITCREYPTIDGRRAADVRFDGVQLPADALIGEAHKALDDIEYAADAAIAAISAEAVGVLRTLHHDTLEYTKQRRQFGQPIANFQALQHRMVDMYMHIEMAQSAAYLATLKLPAAPRERALAASTAKVTVGNACRFVAQNAVQLHGGMGMTDDLPVSHYFKRATMIEAEFGNVDFHLARHAALSRSQ